jgi:hypothetical protein
MTLLDCAKGRHESTPVAFSKRCLLTPEQSNTLIEWASHRAEMGIPASIQDLRAEAGAMAGREPGKQWHKKFLQRFPELQLSRAMKLDPKRAKNFNETVIKNYFDQLEHLHARFPGGIPPQHIWNMDEKGIQMGGGRKNLGKKHLFLKQKKYKYIIRSDNLELVTIIECVSAAGEVVPPSFCLQEGSWPDLHELDDSQWGRYAFTLPLRLHCTLLTMIQVCIP